MDHLYAPCQALVGPAVFVRQHCIFSVHSVPLW